MACTGAVAAAMTAWTLASADPMVIGTEAPFPSFTYIDEAGHITGLDRDIADEVWKRLHWTCEWVNARFDQLIPGVMSGEFDLIIGGIAVTPEREELVSFSVPYDHSDDTVSYLGRLGAVSPDHALIAVQSGTIHESHLRAKGRRIVSFATKEQAIAALLAGKADLAFVPLYPDDPALKVDGFATQYEESVPDKGTALAVCKGNDVLLNPINATLTTMLNDGTIDDFLDRWN